VSLYLIGVDYNSASVEVSEEVFAQRESIGAYWQENEAGVLLTCNRLEIYLNSREETRVKIAGFYRRFPHFLKSGYYRSGQAGVFRHALRLASGLESQIKGEMQILGQIETWQKKLPYGLAMFWQEVVLEAGQVRSLSGLKHKEDNIAVILFRDLLSRHTNGNKLKVMVIGTGKIATLLAETKTDDLQLTFVSHKNKLRALELAKSAGGDAASLQDLPELLMGTDLLISATSSPHRILKKDELARVIARRKQPLEIYDLSMPRDIDPEARELPGVDLKDLDNFSALFKRHAQQIRKELDLAEYLVEEKVKAYEENIKSRQQEESLSLKAG